MNCLRSAMRYHWRSEDRNFPILWAFRTWAATCGPIIYELASAKGRRRDTRLMPPRDPWFGLALRMTADAPPNPILASGRDRLTEIVQPALHALYSPVPHCRSTRCKGGRVGRDPAQWKAGSRRPSVASELEVQGCPNDIGLKIVAAEKLDAARHCLVDFALNTQPED